jgi:hypothetical protein
MPPSNAAEQASIATEDFCHHVARRITEQYERSCFFQKHTWCKDIRIHRVQAGKRKSSCDKHK